MRYLIRHEDGRYLLHVQAAAQPLAWTTDVAAAARWSWPTARWLLHRLRLEGYRVHWACAPPE